jgi:hypothetical protein
MSDAERENAGSEANADNWADALAKALADARPLALNDGNGGRDNESAGMPSIASSVADKL